MLLRKLFHSGSLVTRVYALTILTLLLFTSLGLGLFYQYQFRGQIQDAQDNGAMLVEVVADVVGESAVIGDYDTIQRTLDRITLRSQFNSARFIDLQGGVLHSQRDVGKHARHPEWLRDQIADQLYPLNRAIAVGGVDYGVLRLQFDVNNIADDLWSLLLGAGALAAASICGGILLIWFPLRRWLGTLEQARQFTQTQALPDGDTEALVEQVPLEFRGLFAALAQTSASLRKELAARENALVWMRGLLESMRPADTPPGTPGGKVDDIEAVSQMISDLVIEREIGRLALDNQKFALDQHAIVSITDVTGRILYANDRFCASSGHARETLLGSTHRLVNSGVHPPEFFRELWDTILGGQVWQGEICNRTADGQLTWFASTIVPLTGPNGQPDQFIGISTDITARKQVEAELQQAREVAESANRAKSEFLANMSHEIRTPMNGIIGMTDLVLDTPLNTEQRDYLNTVKSSADALLTIINDILDFSKIEAGKLTIEAIPFDPAAVVNDVARLLTPRARQKALACTVEMAGEPPAAVLGDPVRLRQVLLNLLGNAVKFTAAGKIGLAMTSTAAAPGQLRLGITVTDTGIGIPPDKLEHIFDPFVQEDSSTTRRFGGTGLGLTITRRLVELMGGHIAVSSTVGQGSRFHVELTLPLARAPLLPAPAALAPRTGRLEGQQARLLLAEDNPVNQRLAVALLKKHGYQVQVAHNGEEALAALTGENFDAILMDVQMPVLDGLTATRRIRQQESAAGERHIPIIAMTANAMEGDREICLAAGMDDYLSKPLKVDLLLDTLKRWLGS